MNPRKKYQVFVSSTYEDLKEERKAVMHALLELGCIPSGMEWFPAADEDQWSIIRRQIDESDYYVVILGGRYGSLHPSDKGYTEMEFDYAIESKKPILAFLIQDPEALPEERRERDPVQGKRMDAFREKCKVRHCKFWSTPGELGGVLSRSLIAAFETTPMPGWIRDNSEELKRLAAENAELREELKRLESEPEKPPASPPLANVDERLAAVSPDVKEIFAKVMEFRGVAARYVRQAVEGFFESTGSGIQKHNRRTIVDRIRELVAERLDLLTRQQAFPELHDDSIRDALYAWAVENLADGELRVQGQQGASLWLKSEAKRRALENMSTAADR
ncbi:MAG: DUF4062 domain-containing protein [Gemmataceae bacterium]